MQLQALRYGAYTRQAQVDILGMKPLTIGQPVVQSVERGMHRGADCRLLAGLARYVGVSVGMCTIDTKGKKELAVKKILLLSAMVGMIGPSLSTVAHAQEQGRVLSSTPIVQQVAIPRQVCGYDSAAYSGTSHSNSGAGAVMGAIAGGAIGNQIGGGTGRAAATALGVIGGAVLGNRIEGQNQPPRYQNVQRCNTETYYENRTIGYNVVYEYGGRQYSTQTSYDPGAWIALNVRPSAANYSGQSYSTYSNPYIAQPGAVQTYPVQPPSYVSPPVTIEYNYEHNSHYQHHNPYSR